MFACRIEDDILNLVDEVDIDEFLKEASKAVEDPEKLSQFVREKSTIAIERFLVSPHLGILIRFSLEHLFTDMARHRTISRKCRFQLRNVISLMVGY